MCIRVEYSDIQNHRLCWRPQNTVNDTVAGVDTKAPSQDATQLESLGNKLQDEGQDTQHIQDEVIEDECDDLGRRVCLEQEACVVGEGH